MSDFAQSGLISTLQQLNGAHLPALEKELTALAVERPIALVLPCRGADLDQPALAHIVGELRGADFLSEIIVSTNGADAAGHERAAALFATLPQPVRFLANGGEKAGADVACSGPNIEHPTSNIERRIAEANPAPPLDVRCSMFDVRCSAPQALPIPGKGANVAAALRLLTSEARAAIIVLQDCDVASFRRATLARLCYACAHPDLGYSFAKMYYSRATDRLYGRVSRLFFAPLLQAIVRLSGHHPLVDFLLSFRYPLAGECALTREVAARLPLSPGWGLETGILCELFRRIDPSEICQVDGGSGYDHKHQPAASALAAMSGEIAETLLAQLAIEGLTFERPALAAAYRREATTAVRRSAHLALINGLPFDAGAEEGIVGTFLSVLEVPR